VIERIYPCCRHSIAYRYIRASDNYRSSFNKYVLTEREYAYCNSIYTFCCSFLKSIFLISISYCIWTNFFKKKRLNLMSVFNISLKLDYMINKKRNLDFNLLSPHSKKLFIFCAYGLVYHNSTVNQYEKKTLSHTTNKYETMSSFSHNNKVQMYTKTKKRQYTSCFNVKKQVHTNGYCFIFLNFRLMLRIIYFFRWGNRRWRIISPIFIHIFVSTFKCLWC
jgi:hypothetical protein